MELLSTSDSMLIPYLNTDSPLSMDFCLSPYDHHQTAFIAQPSINMSNPDDLKSVFNDPSGIEIEDLSKPKCALKLKQSLQSLRSIQLTN